MLLSRNVLANNFMGFIIVFIDMLLNLSDKLGVANTKSILYSLNVLCSGYSNTSLFKNNVQPYCTFFSNNVPYNLPLN